MPVLSFDKPKKLTSATEHNAEYQSDTNIAGTYVPNMSEEDKQRWKAKYIGGKDPRVEIRKTVIGQDPSEDNTRWSSSAQVLIIVREKTVIVSANGRMVFDPSTWLDFNAAVAEAVELLHEKETAK